MKKSSSDNPNKIISLKHHFNKQRSIRNRSAISEDDLEYFKTDRYANNISELFYNCNRLESIPISDINVNTRYCTDMSKTFGHCYSITTLDLSNWDTANVMNMDSMFVYADHLKIIIGLNKWNTANVTSMANMFCGCKSLEVLDLSSWDTSNVKNMMNMFKGCSSLKQIKGIIDMKNCTNWKYMFDGCDSLAEVKLKNVPEEFTSPECARIIE